MKSCYFVLFSLFFYSIISCSYVSFAFSDNSALECKKESLDVNQINSSVDAGSFYSIEVSIKQMEDNIVKMAQDLKKLQKQVELSKQIERKHLAEIRRLEKVRMNFLDNSLSGSSAKLEKPDVDTVGDDLKFDSNMGVTVDKKLENCKEVSTQTSQIIPEIRQDIAIEVVGSDL